jgi:hypothetical protein
MPSVARNRRHLHALAVGQILAGDSAGGSRGFKPRYQLIPRGNLARGRTIAKRARTSIKESGGNLFRTAYLVKGLRVQLARRTRSRRRRSSALRRLCQSQPLFKRVAHPGGPVRGEQMARAKITDIHLLILNRRWRTANPLSSIPRRFPHVSTPGSKLPIDLPLVVAPRQEFDDWEPPRLPGTGQQTDDLICESAAKSMRG